MRFIINIVCFLFLLPLIATAQTYKYIGVENGLSNRRIFDIQKDSVGYMWFLTNEGIDRYNGKDIKHYKLIEENKESSFPIHLGWLYFEEKGKLWVIGKAGRIFQYNQEHDVFNRVYKLPKTPQYQLRLYGLQSQDLAVQQIQHRSLRHTNRRGPSNVQ